MRKLRIPVLVVVTGLLVTACTTTDPGASAISEIGEGEGELNLVIWAGYAEDGQTDEAYNWVTPFEDETGCQVNATNMSDSNNGVSLIQSGEYDGISASGDATTRLIASGLVAPVNTDVFENYGNVFADLKDLPHNTVDGVNYGVPHGRGPTCWPGTRRSSPRLRRAGARSSMVPTTPVTSASTTRPSSSPMRRCT